MYFIIILMQSAPTFVIRPQNKHFKPNPRILTIILKVFLSCWTSTTRRFKDDYIFEVQKQSAIEEAEPVPK
jgi:hypothetical protein